MRDRTAADARALHAELAGRLEAPEATQELDRQLNLNESVLRTKVIRPDAR